jgi:hypothetical protein
MRRKIIEIQKNRFHIFVMFFSTGKLAGKMQIRQLCLNRGHINFQFVFEDKSLKKHVIFL